MIHGDRTQSQRNGALSGFEDGKFQVLVATDVASRGIHVNNVAHVINYDLPQIPEDFIHRVGRTGRMGSTGLRFHAGIGRGDWRAPLDRTGAKAEDRAQAVQRLRTYPGADGGKHPAYAHPVPHGGRGILLSNFVEIQ